MIRRPPRSTLDRSSAASDVYKRQGRGQQLHAHRRHLAELHRRVLLPDVGQREGLEGVEGVTGFVEHRLDVIVATDTVHEDKRSLPPGEVAAIAVSYTHLTLPTSDLV